MPDGLNSEWVFFYCWLACLPLRRAEQSFGDALDRPLAIRLSLW